LKLRYTIQAAAELDGVLAYIEAQSPQGAGRVQARIQAMTNLLLQYPGAGRLTGKRGKRRIAASPYPYLIFYEVTDDEIVIHGVRHAARRPSSMPE
jgi:toxin ParE1/3/4